MRKVHLGFINFCLVFYAIMKTHIRGCASVTSQCSQLARARPPTVIVIKFLVTLCILSEHKTISQPREQGSVLIIMRRTALKEKVSILGLTKEYSESASIHGVGYIFSAANAVEKSIW